MKRLLLVLCLAISAFGQSYSRVNTTPTTCGTGLFNGTGGTGGFSCTHTATSGNLVIVAVTYGTNSPASFVVKDNAGSGQTFTTSASARAWNATNSQGIALYWAIANGSSGTSISVTTGGTRIIWFSGRVYEVSSTTGWQATPLDGTPSGGTGNSTSPSSGNTTTTVNGDYIFGVVNNTDGTANSISAGTNYTLWGTSASQFATNPLFQGEDRTQATAGAVAATGTISSGQQWGAVVAGFKGNAPAATVTRRRVVVIQ